MKLPILSENSSITISLMIAIAGLAFWIGGIASVTQANSATLAQVAITQSEFQRDVIQRLSRLEVMIDRNRSSK